MGLAERALRSYLSRNSCPITVGSRNLASHNSGSQNPCAKFCFSRIPDTYMLPGSPTLWRPFSRRWVPGTLDTGFPEPCLVPDILFLEPPVTLGCQNPGSPKPVEFSWFPESWLPEPWFPESAERRRKVQQCPGSPRKLCGLRPQSILLLGKKITKVWDNIRP